MDDDGVVKYTILYEAWFISLKFKRLLSLDHSTKISGLFLRETVPEWPSIFTKIHFSEFRKGFWKHLDSSNSQLVLSQQIRAYEFVFETVGLSFSILRPHVFTDRHAILNQYSRYKHIGGGAIYMNGFYFLPVLKQRPYGEPFSQLRSNVSTDSHKTLILKTGISI